VEGTLNSPPILPFLPSPLTSPPQTIDWCYIFYALNYQIAAILLASTTDWYLLQGVISNIWSLAWAIAVTRINMTAENAWTYDSIIFGGSLVFSFFTLVPMVGIWWVLLLRGRMRVDPIRGSG